MNALPAPLAAALAPFAPPPPKPAGITIDRLRVLLSEADDRWNELLRLPFELKVETPAITDRAPENCEPASYTTRYAADDVVASAADWLINRHFREYEAKIEELQDIRDAENARSAP